MPSSAALAAGITSGGSGLKEEVEGEQVASFYLLQLPGEVSAPRCGGRVKKGESRGHPSEFFFCWSVGIPRPGKPE